MSTETEVVLSSLTREELLKAFDFVEFLEHTYGHEWSRLLEPGHVYDDHIQRMVIDAICFALIREVGIRFGSIPWYAGMPTDDHPQGGILELYQERVLLNPDGQLRRVPGLGPTRVCPACRLRKPDTAAHWARGTDAPTCLACAVQAAPEPVAADPLEWSAA